MNLICKILVSHSLILFVVGSVLAQNSMHLAESQFRNSKFDAALQSLKLAEKGFVDSGNDSMTFVTRNRISRILLIQNNVDSALAILLKNRGEIVSKYGHQIELLAVCNDLIGDCYMSLSDAETAIQYYRKSYLIRSSGKKANNAAIAFSFSNLARYHSFKINIDSALFCAEQGYAKFNNGWQYVMDYPYERIFMEYVYALKIKEIRDHSNDPKSLEDIRNLYKSVVKYINDRYSPEAYQLISVYRNIGNTYTDELCYHNKNAVQKNNHLIAAQLYYDKALLLSNKVLGKNKIDNSTIYFTKALAYDFSFLKDSIQKTLANYDMAIKEIVPTYTLQDSLSQNDLHKCQHKYDLMSCISAKSHAYFKYYTLTGDTQALESAYLMLKYSVPLWDLMIKEFRSPYANRLITIYNLRPYDFLIDFAWELYKTTSDKKYQYAIFNYSELSKRSLQHRILLDAGYRKFLSADVNTIDPDVIQKSLTEKNEIYLQYFNNNYVSVITRDTFIVLNINSPISPDTLLVSLQRSMKENDAIMYQQSAVLIYDAFIKPALIAGKMKHGKLIITTDGILNRIAIAGLVTDSTATSNDFRTLNYICQDYKIQYVLSAQNLVNKLPESLLNNDSLLVFTPSFKSYASLPFSIQLANELHESFGSEIINNRDATSSVFSKKAPEYPVVHLATHAIGDLQNTINTNLLFSDYSNIPDQFPIDSIFQLRMKAKLVVLSACETNVGVQEYGEGTLNFARAFIYSGAQSTLTTLWKVDDQSTSTILRNFYDNLEDNVSISEALQYSQFEYLQNCSSSEAANPLFWSGLVFTGSDQKILLRRNSKHLSVLTVGISFALLIASAMIFYNYKRYS